MTLTALSVLCILAILALGHILRRNIFSGTAAPRSLGTLQHAPSFNPFAVSGEGMDIFQDYEARRIERIRDEESRLTQASEALSKAHHQLSADLIRSGGTREAQQHFDREWHRAIEMSERIYGDYATHHAKMRLGL